MDIYLPILLAVLNLYGLAIHTSLERTLGKYLKSTDGVFRNELRDDWELGKIGKLLCTNNPAERPFAVAKGNSCFLTSDHYRNLTHTHFQNPCRIDPCSVYEYLSKLKFANTGLLQSKHVQWFTQTGRIIRQAKTDTKQRHTTMWSSFVSSNGVTSSHYKIV